MINERQLLVLRNIEDRLHKLHSRMTGRNDRELLESVNDDLSEIIDHLYHRLAEQGKYN